MVSVHRENGNFIFEVRGVHKLWALKSSLTIPANHILSVKQYTQGINYIPGIRMPGTFIPYVIAAGTFVADEGVLFCDIVNDEKCIEVELQDERYKKLIIEVEDPQAIISLLNEKP